MIIVNHDFVILILNLTNNYFSQQCLCLLAPSRAQAKDHLSLFNFVFICPIAIAYSMGQIIKSVCVCLSVCVCVRLSVCEHSHGRLS